MTRLERAALPTITVRTWTVRLLVWPLCVLAVFYHLEYGHPSYSEVARLHAGLICCVAMLATAYSPVGTIPTAAIGLSYFYAALGMPIFRRSPVYTIDGVLRLSSRSFDSALEGALTLASVALITTWVVDRASTPFGVRLQRLLDDGGTYTVHHRRVARALAALTLALHTVVALRGQSLGALHQPLSLLAAPIIPISLLLWDAEATGSRGSRILLWGAVAYMAGLGMLSGMVSATLVPGIIVSALIWGKRGKLPITMLAIGVAVLLVLNPAKHAYRQLAWFGGSTATIDRIEMWAQALEATYSGRSTEGTLQSSIESANSRMNTLGQVAHMYEWVPSRVPHAGAERWLFVPAMFAPRILWPDKPIHSRYFNRDYTNTFRLQSARRLGSTTITLPAVGDGYWRLGYTGVVAEGMLLGLLLGLGQGLSRSRTRTALLLGGAFILQRTDVHVFGMLNGIVQGFFVALAVAWLANRFSRAPRANQRQVASQPLR